MMRMSPAPCNPGKPDGTEINDGVTDPPIPPATDSSDIDSAEEAVGQPVDDGMGYQLLPQDFNAGHFVSNADDDSPWESDSGDEEFAANNDDDEETQVEVENYNIGYEIMEGGVDDVVVSSSVADNRGYDAFLPEHLQLKTSVEDAERRELWKTTDSSGHEKVAMDPDHADKIKSIMQAITLPPANLPAWASVIPEEEWKARLIDELTSSKEK